MSASSNHVSSLKLNEISADFIRGVDAVKWPEDNKRPLKPSKVKLSIDPKGFYLICVDQDTRKTECFDLTLIHDTRTGSQVSLSQEVNDCSDMNIGILGVLPPKCLTIYYGNTFVPSANFRIIHFAFKEPKIALNWTETLFEYGHNKLLRNLSSLDCLEKIYSKMIEETVDRKNNIIPINSIILFLCNNHADETKKKKISSALKIFLPPHAIESGIHRNEFTFDIFFRIYMYLMDRQEINTLFDSLVEHGQDCLSWEGLQRFIKNQSDDTHKMESSKQKVKDLINKYTNCTENSTTEGMTKESFLRYLLSFDNLIVDPVKYGPFMNMNKSLTHYFICSSHNTYLTGGQWIGRADEEMYRQVLLTGCRCIELDVVDPDGKGEIIEIKHIHTPIKPILFVDVVTAIRDYAFKVSSYPLILSIENHCSPRAQDNMAKIFVESFGDKLLTEPLSNYPCDENCLLPSPNQLRNKILIKNKKLSSTSKTKVNNSNSKSRSIISTSNSNPNKQQNMISSPSNLSSHPRTLSAESLQLEESIRINPRYGFVFDAEELFEEDEQTSGLDILERLASHSDLQRESKATKNLSDIVVYTVPVSFKTFTRARELNRSYEMSSWSEDEASTDIRESARDFLEYNQRQLSRIYPRGRRTNSTNFDPYLYWPIGCQLVALNYQTLDVPMQVNLGMFSFNNNCGYIEKPAALCKPRNLFDPRFRNNVEDVVSYDINLKIFSGQFLCQKDKPIRVDISMYGLYGNPTKEHINPVIAKYWNGFQAIYDDNKDINSTKFPIQFTKIILQDIAGLHFAVTSPSNDLVGQCFLPVCHIRSGYRHVVLRNEINLPVRSASLFIYIQRKIHISAKDEALFKLLDNPPKVTSQNEEDNLDEFSTKVVLRNSNSSDNVKHANPIYSLDKTCYYREHAIAGSGLNDKEKLCKIFSVNDVIPDEYCRLKNDIEAKWESIIADFKKKIEKEDANLKKISTIPQDLRQRSKSTNSILSKKDNDLPEQRLFKIYDERFRRQKEVADDLINKFFDEFKERIKKDYKRQYQEISKMFEEEKSKVEKSAQNQRKRNELEIKSSETNRTKIEMLKQQSIRNHSEYSTSTINQLKTMRAEVEKMLDRNFQINLKQLEERNSFEIKRYTNELKNGLDSEKRRLHCRMYQNEHHVVSLDNSPSTRHHTRITTASLSTDDTFSSEIVEYDELPRRQTMNQ